jgi:Spy/CpxP family protein refolding chaperone
MRKWIIALAVCTFAAALAFAQEHEGRPQHGPGGPPSFAAMFGEKLALTGAQKDQIGAIEKKTHEDNAAFFDSTHQLMEQVHAAREANDTAKLDSLKPAIDANRAEMKKIRDAQLTKIEAVLTADQRAQFEKIRKENEERMKDHAAH